jgi:ABC-2 type transport system ATP-binding protein
MAEREPPPDSSVAVSADGLGKSYHVPLLVRRRMARLTGGAPPATTEALDALSFQVERGEVYGVLGPNGAGKTTLMKVLATVLIPDTGNVQVLGQDIVKQAHTLRARIGVVLGEYERTFHWRLSGRQNLRFFADFYALPRREVTDRIDQVLAAVDLTDVADRMFNAYSTGMKHRLALARALLPDPELLLLDEPTAGLDPDSSGKIAQLVRERADEGTAVVYTTHRLHEAGVLCDRILVLERGKRIAEASPAQLAHLAKGQQVVEVKKSGGGPWERSFVEPIAALAGVLEWETRAQRLLFYTRNEPDVVEDVVGKIRAQGHGTLAITIRPPDVEDAFLTLVETARKNDEATKEGQA